ncbi:MAG: hypothetical protein KatS3mg023_3839 [Armatimonadota bacterium]|nr:MAG: hypothetical protein KatS3mg023_3839 [Armatimonadota bacterium]
MSLNRSPVDRSRPMLEAYGTGLTTAEILWASRGWGPLRIFTKERSQPEGSYVQKSDWQTAGLVRLSGLQEGGLYTVRAVNRAGRTWDVPLHLPRRIRNGSDNTFLGYAVAQDPQGRLYATTKGANDGTQWYLRRSEDGGQNWVRMYIYSTIHNRIYYYDNKLFGTTWAGWPSQRDKLFYTPVQPDYDGPTIAVMADPMFNPDPSSNRVDIYPWAFEPRGPFWIVGADGNWIPGGGETAFNESNCNNRIYYTNDYWHTRQSMIAPPGGGIYTKHVHAICWNPESQCYFISIGDHIRRNYLVSPDLQQWQQVADGIYHNTGQASGASIGITWLPDGSFLAGNDDVRSGHITRFRANGTHEIVLRLPEWHAAMVWDIWACDDGEVWATFRQDGSTTRIGSVMASLDWGKSWRTVFRAPLGTFTPAFIGGCHETRRLHGEHIIIDQGALYPTSPAWVWMRFRQ